MAEAMLIVVVCSKIPRNAEPEEENAMLEVLPAGVTITLVARFSEILPASKPADERTMRRFEC
jgi:hypothetical protein